MQQMLTILGPTASGKTPLAAALAHEIGGEIISADSRQVYRRMDIGTGKDLNDYTFHTPHSTFHIPHHLIDICEPGTKYNLFQYQQDFFDAYQDIRRRGAVPILCGGTGLYIEAVLKGYKLSPVPQNPELRASLDGKTLDELTEMLIELKQRNGSVTPVSVPSGLSKSRPTTSRIPYRVASCRLSTHSLSVSISTARNVVRRLPVA